MERRKALPDDADFRDFDYHFGVDEAGSEVVHLCEINKSISRAESEQLKNFYLEVMVKACHRRRKAPATE